MSLDTPDITISIRRFPLWPGNMRELGSKDNPISYDYQAGQFLGVSVDSHAVGDGRITVCITIKTSLL